MRTLWWKKNSLYIIDQTKLPSKLVIKKLKNYPDVIRAIKTMQIRGAPAIGIAGAFGIALAALKYNSGSYNGFISYLKKVGDKIVKSRPTAVNIYWAVTRILRKVKSSRVREIGNIKRIVVDEARKILKEDIEVNRKIGANGARLLKKKKKILTHCNAGALATADYGTASRSKTDLL